VAWRFQFRRVGWFRNSKLLRRQHTAEGLLGTGSRGHARWWRATRSYPPALLIHSRYASACLSTTCCLRSLRNERRFSTRSRSLANSLQKREQNRTYRGASIKCSSTQTRTKRRVDRSVSTSIETDAEPDEQTDRRTDSVWIVRKPWLLWSHKAADLDDLTTPTHLGLFLSILRVQETKHFYSSVRFLKSLFMGRVQN